MSVGQKSITATSGLQRFFKDIRYNRHRFRQFIGIAFLIILTIAGEPANYPALFFPGVIAIILGIAIRLWSSGHVKKDKVLATNGPYAYVRHPLYVGNHLITFGFCLASGLWWGFPAWILIGILFYPQTIRHEDRLLKKLFPGEWKPWAQRTRALIPRLTPYKEGARGQWSFRQSLRQNGEPIIALLLLSFVILLYLRLP
jgi:protein-S-isoprenylcysteine O-methyltransferase Ste14